MGFTLFCDHTQADLFPLSLTRPLFELRCGIFSLREKWAFALGENPGTSAPGFLSPIFDNFKTQANDIWINAKFYPEPELVKIIKENTPSGTVNINEKGEVISFCLSEKEIKNFTGISGELDLVKVKNDYKNNPVQTEHLSAIRELKDLFQLNKKFIEKDFQFIKTPGEKTKDNHSILYGADNIYFSPGVQMKACILNAEDGPIYLGKNAVLQEGAIIHGAHSIGENCVISMGAKFRGDSSFGPFCKMGGEIANSVVQGYSSKAHDGYLGNSLIGQWCNLGADSNTSNLKNNYTSVRVWNYAQEKFVDTHTLFFGLVMADHSKCGINTMFNTGTVAGVGSNIFGAGYPRNFIPDFSWGGKEGLTTYKPEKVFETERIVMQRRGMTLDSKLETLLLNIFETTKKFRTWEKE